MDLISRIQAFEEFNKDPMGGLNYRQILETLPSAEPERKKGKWKIVKYPYAKCSICNTLFDAVHNEQHYCSNCGAEMKGEWE